MRFLFFIGSFLFFLTLSVKAVERVSSSTGRFVVLGDSSTEIARLAIDLEKFAAQIEELMGETIPVFQNQPIALRLFNEADKSYGDIVAQSRQNSGLLLQRVKILNLNKLPESRLYTEVGRCILARFVMQQQKKFVPVKEIPDWIAIGFAYLAHQELRKSNEQVFLTRWKSGEIDAPFQFLTGIDATGMDYVEEGLQALVFEWLLSNKGAPWSMMELLNAYVQGPPPIAEAVFQWAGLPPKERVQLIRWDLWMLKKYQKVYPSWRKTTEEKITELKRLLLIYPGEYSLNTSLFGNEPLSWDSLAQFREESWYASLATDLVRRLQLLSLGAEPEFQVLLQTFSGYLVYSVTGNSPPENAWPDNPDAQTWSLIWKQVMQRFLSYEQEVVNRKKYLDQLEQNEALLRQRGW